MPTTTRFDERRFRNLLNRWNSHQELRSSGASVARLARSRVDLELARLSAREVI